MEQQNWHMPQEYVNRLEKWLKFALLLSIGIWVISGVM